MKEKSVKKYYDLYSPNYDQFYERIQIEKFHELNSIIDFSFQEWIVDLGGGTGLFAEFINLDIITLDISFNMLDTGHNSARLFQGITCDIQSIPLRKNSVSTIYSFTALQNCSQPLTAIREMKRISTKDAKGIITTLAKTYDGSIMLEFEQLFNEVETIHLNLEDIAFRIS